MVALRGLSLLGAEAAVRNGGAFRAKDPATGQELEPLFHSASPAEVDQAVALAVQAAPLLARCGGARRAALLRRLAQELEEAAPELLPRAMAETALPFARVSGELGRTCFQLRRFAEVAEEGSWVDARLDSADPARQTAPRPELRAMRVPLGPVAVFGASNFPLAFGALGGDTASALAAGCPVVAKAHPLNPGTSEIAARCAQRALAAEGLPAGAFSLLFDGGHAVGAALVRHPGIRAVGFTGSLRGGRALLALAQARPEPIPVFAEMGSVNPVLLLPEALAARPEELARSLAASVLQGTGQFCTNPGLLLALEGPGLDRFRAALGEALKAALLSPMLSEGLAQAYREGLAHLAAATGGEASEGAALLETRGAALKADPALAEEVFGPCTLLAVCADEAELGAALDALPGQLTATLWMEPGDAAAAERLLPKLQRLAGRVLFNGVPTGVEVGYAMVHGGPWPATSAPASSSVGTLAIQRWARPLCFQDAPETLLPPELHAANPLGLWRLRDGRMGRH